MCDPVTMSLVSAGMSYGGTAMAASSTGWIASMGTGMVNAASLFNYSSSYGSLGGSLSASAAGLGTSLASTIGAGASVLSSSSFLMGGLQMGSGAASAYGQKLSAELEMQKYQMQKKQYKAEMERIQLEAKAEELDRRKRYLAMKSENDAHISISNVDIASNSYKALLETNRDQYLNDISYVKLIAGEKRLSSVYGFKEADIAQKAVRKTAPIKQFTTMAAAGVETYKMFRQKSKPAGP